MRGDITLLLPNTVFKDLKYIFEGMIPNDAPDELAPIKSIYSWNSP